MKLRAKSALNLFSVAALMVGCVFAASYFTLLGSFQQVETDDVLRGVDRCIDVLHERQDALADRTADWADWDDSYQFLVDGNQDFIDSNLSDELFNSYFKAVNYVFLINLQGKIIYGKGADSDAGKEIPMPKAFSEHFALGNLLLQHPSTDSRRLGFVLTENGPVMLASYPCLTSKMEGPPHGTVIFGVQISDRYLEKLSATLKTSIRIASCDQGAMPEDFKSALLTLSNGAKRTCRVLSEERIAGYALFDDVYGNPAFVLRVDKPRDIYARGKRALLSFGALLAGTGILIALATLLLLERSVLSRLALLTQEVSAIHSGSDLNHRVTVSGRDEIALLGQNMNQMLSDIERATHEVELSEARLRAIFDAAVDGIIIADDEGCILSFNKSAEEIFGYNAEEVCGKPLLALMPEPYHSEHLRFVREYLSTHRSKLLGTGHEALGRRKDGSIFPMYVAISEVQQGGKRIFAGIVRDITERKKYEEVLTRAATHDALTGLLNRGHFEKQLEVAMNAARRYGHSLSLCMGDADCFKEINDVYGHTVGDCVLAKIGELLREGLRHEDLCGRFGGDEFCVCFAHSSGAEAAKAIERVREALAAATFDAGEGKSFKATATFGLADFTRKDMTPKELFEAADKALYSAKQAGRNRSHVLGVDL